MRYRRCGIFGALAAAALAAAPSCAPGGIESTLPNALVLAIARVEKGPSGYQPQPARLGILLHGVDGWSCRFVDDPDSNVFHKALAYPLPDGKQALLTAGGTRAILKLWLPGGRQQVVWEADFGGKFSRMRDIEVADIDGDGVPEIVVATHDQGVVAVVHADGQGGFSARELDRHPDTIVHEVEVGDLDGDGVPEIYATPSRPNRLDGTPQPGEIVRYDPETGTRTVVAELGDRHAKEILVDDVDGDGRDELYAVVDAVSGGQVEIRRYDAGTPPDGGLRVAVLPDTMGRFLTAGDIDGDGVKELVATTHRAGIWLLRRHGTAWMPELVDARSSGFEHAAVLTDLDGDGIDELYVANDGASEVNRYAWRAGRAEKTVLFTHPGGLSGFTWNITPVPVAALAAFDR